MDGPYIACSGGEEKATAKATRFTELAPLLVYPSNQSQTGATAGIRGSSNGLEREADLALLLMDGSYMACSGGEEKAAAKATHFTELAPLLVYPSSQSQTGAEPAALGRDPRLI